MQESTHDAERKPIVHKGRTCVIETPLPDLDDIAKSGTLSSSLGDILSPREGVFIRDNGLWPKDDIKNADDWPLTIRFGDEEKEFTIGKIKREFREHIFSQVAVLSCAGIGRSNYAHLLGKEYEGKGIQWGPGAAYCWKWIGARLSALLATVGITEKLLSYEESCVSFHSPDYDPEHPSEPAISRSIPLKKALAPECMFAFAANGQPLSRDEGGPGRLVAPGEIGANWPKRLCRLEGHLSEWKGAKTEVYRDRHGNPLKLTRHGIVTNLKEDFLIYVGDTIRGLTWGNGPATWVSFAITEPGTLNHTIRNWRQAQLYTTAARNHPFAWQAFSFRIPPGLTGDAEIIVRAWDAHGAQELDPMKIWNEHTYMGGHIAPRFRGRISARSRERILAPGS